MRVSWNSKYIQVTFAPCRHINVHFGLLVFLFFLFLPLIPFFYIIELNNVMNIYWKPLGSIFYGSLCTLYFEGDFAISLFPSAFFIHHLSEKCVKQKLTNVCWQQKHVTSFFLWTVKKTIGIWNMLSAAPSSILYFINRVCKFFAINAFLTHKPLMPFKWNICFNNK